MNENNKKGFSSLSTERYEDRIVIFIDILGFKNFINNKSDVFIKDFFGFFEEMVSEGEKSLDAAGNGSFKMSFTFFSDTIVISIPPNIFPRNSHIGNFYLLQFLRTSISQIQMYALRHGLLTRGCVTYGQIFHQGRTWFGPAINEAYKHETEYAIYPRVIVSARLVEFLKSEIEHDHKHALLNVLYANDGFYFINYLDVAFICSSFGSDYAAGHDILKNTIEKNLHSNKLSEREKIKWRWLGCRFNDYIKEQKGLDFFYKGQPQLIEVPT